VTDAAANSLTECFVAQLPTTLPDVYLLRLTLADKHKRYSTNDYWQSTKNGDFTAFNQMGNTRLTVKIVEKLDGHLRLQIANTGVAPAVAIKLNLVDSIDGRVILPTYFSDGYFNLLPGEKKFIEMEWPQKTTAKVALIAEGYNLKKQQLLSW
jgi:hypothetical protein